MSASLNVTGTDLPLVCVDYFTQNTDITGIGVRVSFYVQSVLLGERDVSFLLFRHMC